MERSSRIPLGAIKTAAVLLMLASAVAVPGWLYYERGRKMPLRVVLEAERYVVQAGKSLTLKARILPAGAELDESSWQGPGVGRAGGTSLSWRAPKKAGIYTLRFVARRGATRSEEELSLRVLPRAPESYPLSSPPPAEAPQALTTTCPKAESGRFEIHGARCRGGRVIVELKAAAPWRRIWMTSAGGTSRGRFRALRLAPKAGEARQMRAMLVDAAARCVHRYETTIVAKSCVGGPRRAALFADFQWELANPGLFRLAAKPPRGGQERVVYRWRVEGKEHLSKSPYHMLRVQRRARHLVVSLEVEADGERAETIGLLTDRSFEGP